MSLYRLKIEIKNLIKQILKSQPKLKRAQSNNCKSIVNSNDVNTINKEVIM